MSDKTRIIVGRINGLYGVQGWVKIFSYTDPIDNILTYVPWQLCQKGEWRTVTVCEGKSHGKNIIARLEGYVDRDTAVTLLGVEIAIEAQQLPSLQSDEYYWKDLIGLAVINLDNVHLGVVDHLLETGANDVIVVKGERERLIPFLKNQVIVAIDLVKGIIQVDWDADFLVSIQEVISLDHTILDMHIGVITLFPEMFHALHCGGVTARALEQQLLQLHFWNPRDFTISKHGCVDDRPYGGGPGMVMQVQPVRAAIQAAKALLGQATSVIYLSPQGRQLDQSGISYLGLLKNFILLSGRYEGIDERVIMSDIDEEWSIGDYVLSGGELPAMVIIDALARHLPGALGHQDSAAEDSFYQGLLDYPHYSRPEKIDGQTVPKILLTGDHAKIARWRLKQALGRTWRRRPDLLDKLHLTAEQQQLLEEFIGEYEGKVT